MKLRRTLLYLVGFGLQRVSTLLLVPLLVSHLPPEDFTRYGLLVSFLALVAPLASMRIQTAPARLLFDHTESRTKASLIHTCMVGGSVLALLVLALLQLSLLANLVKDPIGGGVFWLQAAILICCLGRVIGEHATTLVRAVGDAKLFLVLTSVEGAVLVGVAAVGYALQKNLYPVTVVAFTLSAVVSAVMGIWLTREHRKEGVFQQNLLKEAFAYAWPTALNLVAAWFVAQSGRWIGASVLPLDSMASYTLVALLMVIVGMVVRTVFEAMRPELGKAFAQADYKLGMSLIRRGHMLGIGVAVLGWVGIIVLWFLMAPRLGVNYQPDSYLLLVAVITGVIDCFAVKNLNTLLCLKRSGDQLKAGLVGGGVSLLASLLLVLHLGTLGLLLGAAAGFLAQMVLTDALVKKALSRDS